MCRAADDRLLIGTQKCLPHILCCRLWRWPDLQNHMELKGIAGCECTYSSRKEIMCVNPYHYERIEAPGRVLPYNV